MSIKRDGHQFEQVTTKAEDGFDTWTCCDCGAHAETIDAIQHYKTCALGEAERWEKYYAEEPT
jgi:hypothetical protein